MTLLDQLSTALTLLDLALAERDDMHGRMKGNPAHWSHHARALLSARPAPAALTVDAIDEEFPADWTEEMKAAAFSLLSALRAMPVDRARYTLALGVQQTRRARRKTLLIVSPEADGGR